MTERKISINGSAMWFINVYGPLAQHKSMGFVNSFIRDISVPATGEDINLYLLYRPVGAQEQLLSELVWACKSDKVYRNYYSYDHGYKVLVVKLPKEFEHDFEMFLQGRYGELSPRLTSTIPETGQKVDEWGKVTEFETTQWKILNKQLTGYTGTKKVYPGECYPVPVIDEETLNIAQYYNLYKQTT